jgi:hypothetical protein
MRSIVLAALRFQIATDFLDLLIGQVLDADELVATGFDRPDQLVELPGIGIMKQRAGDAPTP